MQEQSQVQNKNIQKTDKILFLWLHFVFIKKSSGNSFITGAKSQIVLIYFFEETASLKAFPGLNTGTLLAGIVIFLRVFGFTPVLEAL